jgi:hypothetical protein
MGTNGLGNSGSCILGVYPTSKLAKARVKEVTMDVEEYGFRDVFYNEIKKFNIESGAASEVFID